ncbi:hypothetical protein WSM22_05640 [Cytophagales bacterium WSM2-2]|nr:hypothetical protein WSM22_05640 [Cytophagales bacterium WSM2-2]
MEKSIRINYRAVVTTGLVAFILSIAWYSPALFGGLWLRYRNGPPPASDWTLTFAPLRELIASYVVALLITRLSLMSSGSAVKIIFLLWIAFHGIGMAGAVIWDNMPWQLAVVRR